VFDEEGRINPKVKFAALAAHVWFTETGRPLGTQDGTAYGLLYNGVLGDKSVNGGNVLTTALLERLKRDSKGHAGPWVIYGEATRLSTERLRALRVTFKQTPYDIRAR
jgi:adenine-specific DNA-methyltransferase